jgi:hypothetical protein
LLSYHKILSFLFGKEFSVSDDEYHRYRFFFFLSSTSLLETFLLASSFALCSVRLRFMSCFRERMLSTIPFFLFVSISYICMRVLFGWSQSFPFFVFLVVFFSFRIHSYSAVSLSLCRQGLDHFTERAHILFRDKQYKMNEILYLRDY